MKLDRNPFIILPNGTRVQTIGDVHLGRSFINGVPLDKRGLIEAMVKAKFEKLLETPADYIVQMGDIFDKFQVDESEVIYVAETFLKIARKHKDRRYVLLRGNHDESKDVTKTSSFTVLSMILREAGLPNIHVVSGVSGFDEKDRMGMIGWSPESSAKELADLLVITNQDTPLAAVFGHWDVNLPDNASHFNHVPTKQLKDITTLIITGHDHKPGEEHRDGIRIIKTGSILPLAHGEELETDELIYTIKPSDYDPALHDGKIVRFILTDEEEIPEGDFLQVKAIMKPAGATETDEESDADSFDLAEILREFLIKEKIDEDLAAEVVERFSSRNVD